MTAKAALKTFEITLARTLPATPEEAFDAWLDRDTPGTIWEFSNSLVLPKSPRAGDLYYFVTENDDGPDFPHYGQFREVERPGKLRHTWMSNHTRGLESMVTVTFKKKGKDTLMTLNHANLPADDFGRAHQGGWEFFLGEFEKRFAKVKA
jgi:uncharacterized protein YndB with AHSA1/START domain